MTLPNRMNYTPGEKRRERKYQALDETMSTHPNEPSAASIKQEEAEENQALPAQHHDEALREELLQVLAGMAPGSSQSAHVREAHVRTLEQHMTRLAKSKSQVEAARVRLYADPCYQQLPAREDIMSFSALLEENASPSSAGSDPLEQLLTGMAADTGLQASKPENHGKSSSRVDPQWVSLFQQAGPERQQLINGLNKLDRANYSSMPELEAAMDMVQDTPMRNKYQRSVNNLHDWGKNRLYQQMRASMLSRGVGHGARSAPTSPIDSPLRQPPKKRTNLSKNAKTVLRAWFEEHLHHPYPTEEEKEWLSIQGAITIEQVNNWFINTRGRKWKPMLKRLIDDKKAGVDSKLYDRLVEKIEQPYHN